MTKTTNSTSMDLIDDVTDASPEEEKEEATPATSTYAKKTEELFKMLEETSKRGLSGELQLLEPPAEKRSKKDKVDLVVVVKNCTSSIDAIRTQTKKLAEAQSEHQLVSTSAARGIGKLTNATNTLFAKMEAVEKKIDDVGRLLSTFVPPPPSAPFFPRTEGEEKADSESAIGPVTVEPWDVEMENSSPPPPPRGSRQIVGPPAGNRPLLAHPQLEEANYGFVGTVDTSTSNLDGYYRIPKKPAALRAKESLKPTKPTQKMLKNCMFCGGNHRSQDCPIFTTAIARINTLKMRKLCPSCGMHAFDGTCPYTPPVCGCCRGRHQTALCGKTYV